MSDLQTALLGIGACVVAGVYAFNWWQERQFKRRSELAFAREHDDVLMPAKQSADTNTDPVARIEPRLDAALSSAVTAAEIFPTRILPALMIDPVIDYVVDIELAAPAASASLHAQLIELTSDWNKPVLAAGYDATATQWQPAGVDSNAAYARLRFAVQMSNRAGCVDQDKLQVFRATVQSWADNEGAASVKSLEPAVAHSMAVQIDRFCSDVDIAIGVNVITRGGPFAGTKIRALAEARGMKLESDGLFYQRNDAGNVVYSLDNHEPMPFMPEQIKSLTTSGVTFLLDVPCVAEGIDAFEVMLATAHAFSSTLEGTLVDDNRTALTDETIDKIRRQLTGILAKMEAGQIAAGGPRALRLFS